MENRTIAEVIAEIGAALDRIEAMVAELAGKKAAHEAEIAQEPAQAEAEPSWSEDMAFIAESAESAAQLLDEVSSSSFYNVLSIHKPFCAPESAKDALRTAMRRLADCREALARRVGGEQLSKIKPCDIELLYYQINVWGEQTEQSLLRRAEIAASSLRDVAAAARKGRKSRRARKDVAISFNVAVSSACDLRDYILGDEQKEAAA